MFEGTRRQHSSLKLSQIRPSAVLGFVGQAARSKSCSTMFSHKIEKACKIEQPLGEDATSGWMLRRSFSILLIRNDPSLSHAHDNTNLVLSSS